MITTVTVFVLAYIVDKLVTIDWNPKTARFWVWVIALIAVVILILIPLAGRGPVI